MGGVVSLFDCGMQLEEGFTTRRRIGESRVRTEIGREGYVNSARNIQNFP
jgi:hypothetical protein